MTHSLRPNQLDSCRLNNVAVRSRQRHSGIDHQVPGIGMAQPVGGDLSEERRAARIRGFDFGGDLRQNGLYLVEESAGAERCAFLPVEDRDLLSRRSTRLPPAASIAPPEQLVVLQGPLRACHDPADVVWMPRVDKDDAFQRSSGMSIATMRRFNGSPAGSACAAVSKTASAIDSAA